MLNFTCAYTKNTIQNRGSFNIKWKLKNWQLCAWIKPYFLTFLGIYGFLSTLRLGKELYSLWFLWVINHLVTSNNVIYNVKLITNEDKTALFYNWMHTEYFLLIYLTSQQCQDLNQLFYVIFLKHKNNNNNNNYIYISD